MAIRDKNTLKTYFETGDIPSQNQFADLIDSLKHENDTSFTDINNEEIISIANRLVNINTPFIEYRNFNIGDSIAWLDVTQQNGKNQVIEIRDTQYLSVKQYFSGTGPYTIKLKEFQGEELGSTEYYSLYWELNQNYRINKVFGNNLPDIPEGFEFGVADGKRCYFQFGKDNFGQELNIVHSYIKFINNTNIHIEYRTESSYWSDKYRTEDTVTDHINIWDYLLFSYNADMTNETHTIECNIYNIDTDELLTTGYLTPGQNNQNAPGGATINGVRNIRIECTRQ